MSLLDRLSLRRDEVEAPTSKPAADEQVFATKALRKFLYCLQSREAPVLLDLGPAIGSNVSFFGEQLQCKIHVEDIFTDLDRYERRGNVGAFPEFLADRFSKLTEPVDGILCWDLIDYLDRRSAQTLAGELVRLLRPEGVLLGFFGTTQARDTSYTKYVIIDPYTLQYRTRGTASGRHSILLNRDIIRLFSALRVSDSFLLQNNLREILFRKPSWEA